MCKKENKLFETTQVRFSHVSAGELKSILKLNLQEFEQLTAANIDHWYQEMGKFCSGCTEGKMKEHARIHSSKPLQLDKPEDVTVGDIMIVEGLKNTKKPLMIHVDVCSKFITGVPLKDKSEQVCTNAIFQIKAINKKELKQSVFDREPQIMPILKTKMT
jgi:hypothetical protein